MENFGTNQQPGTQDSNFAGGNMGASPALDALKNAQPVQPQAQSRVNPNPVIHNPNIVQQQPGSVQLEPNDIFNQISQAVEPGLFEANIPLESVPSSNDKVDYQPNVQQQQPQQQIATQQQQLAEALQQPLPNQVQTPIQPMQPQNQSQFVDPNLVRQPDVNAEQRYSDSSKEAHRLSIENAQLKKQVDSIAPVMPLVLKLKDSESLRNMVNGYYGKGGIAPEDLKKALKLPDDFVFNGDEAFKDPKSDSAKLLASSIDMASFARANQVRDEIMATLKKEQEDAKKLTERQSFQSTNKLTQDQMGELDIYMQTHDVTLDDIWYLKNRGLREQNIAQNVQQDVINQMHNVRSVMPQTLTGASQVPVDINSEEALFNNAFGNAQSEKGFFDVTT